MILNSQQNCGKEKVAVLHQTESSWWQLPYQCEVKKKYKRARKKKRCLILSHFWNHPSNSRLVSVLCDRCDNVWQNKDKNKNIIFLCYYSAPRKKDKLCLVKKPFAIKCKNALILIFYNKIHDIFMNTLSSIYNWTTAESLDWNK